MTSRCTPQVTNLTPQPDKTFSRKNVSIGLEYKRKLDWQRKCLEYDALAEYLRRVVGHYDIVPSDEH